MEFTVKPKVASTPRSAFKPMIFSHYNAHLFLIERRASLPNARKEIRRGDVNTRTPVPSPLRHWAQAIRLYRSNEVIIKGHVTAYVINVNKQPVC